MFRIAVAAAGTGMIGELVVSRMGKFVALSGVFPSAFLTKLSILCIVSVTRAVTSPDSSIIFSISPAGHFNINFSSITSNDCSFFCSVLCINAILIKIFSSASPGSVFAKISPAWLSYLVILERMPLRAYLSLTPSSSFSGVSCASSSPTILIITLRINYSRPTLGAICCDVWAESTIQSIRQCLVIFLYYNPKT